MSEFFSQGSNFLNALQSSVDPRTAVYSFNLPFASLDANPGLGPAVDVSLGYQSRSSQDCGLGAGIAFPFTTYDAEHKTLRLSTGENFKVIDTPAYTEVLQQKIKNFLFKRTGSEYRVIHKNGTIEILDGPASGFAVKNIRQILSPAGHSLQFSWESRGKRRLTGIADTSGNVLLRMNYDNASAPFVSVFPETDEQYDLVFHLFNNRLQIAELAGTDYAWRFAYNNLGLISDITYPTGLSESVEYIKDKMHFPGDALPPLPVAFRLSRVDSAGTLLSSSTYEFSKTNYLGYLSGASFNPDSDNLYTVLTDYQYFSDEFIRSDGEDIHVHRMYNRYHLLLEETTRRGGASSKVAYTYYADPGQPFDKQPALFQFIRQKTLTLTSEEGLTRTENTLYEFDQYGNPSLEVLPDGTRTATSWYSKDGEAGCPADPAGFTRYMKSQVMTPPATAFTTPAQRRQYTYGALGSTRLVVQTSCLHYANDTPLLHQKFSYHADPNTLMFGRPQITEFTRYSPDNPGAHSQQLETYETRFTEKGVVQVLTTAGYDGLSVSTTRIVSPRSGLLLSESSENGVETHYVYDNLGRLLTRTLAAGSPWQQVTCWEHARIDGRLCTTETDAAGNRRRMEYDAMGRPLRQYTRAVDKTDWLLMEESQYNLLSEVQEHAWFDRAGTHATMSRTVHNEYDSWGNLARQQDSAGSVSLCQRDVVSMTTREWVTGKGHQTATNFTQKDIRDRPLTVQTLNNASQVLEEQRYEWDGVGNLCREFDASGYCTTRTYDLLGRVVSQTLEDGTVVQRTYAPYLAGDHVTSVSVTGRDESGLQKTWVMGSREYDSLGRVVTETCGGRKTSYRYTGACMKPTAVTLPDGSVLSYTYIPELDDAISTESGTGFSRRYQYDARTGALLSITGTDAVSVENEWYPSGELKAERTRTADGGTHSHLYSWTPGGYLDSQTDHTGATTAYQRDAHGRVVGISDPALTVTQSYNAFGLPEQQMTTGTGTHHRLGTWLEYNEQGQECRRILTGSYGEEVVVTQEWLRGGLLGGRRMALNGRDILLESFEYDTRNRLVCHSAEGSKLPADAYGHKFTRQRFRYDVLNNLRSVVTTLADRSVNTTTFLFSHQDDPTRLTEMRHSHPAYPGTTVLEYDDCGRLTRDDKGHQLRYDSLGRLTENSGQACVTYGYDGQGRLVIQSTDTGSRRLFYSGQILAGEGDSEGGGYRKIHSGSHCLGVVRNGKLALTGCDHHGSLLWSVGEDGDTGNLHGWQSYGAGRGEEGLPGYNGERIDPDSGVYHLGNGYRAYNPVLMRFNCPDNLSPFGAGGINAYAYCAGDPINRTDPSGHLSGQAIAGIALGVVGLLFSVFTAGMSIVVAGSVSAAIASASTVSLVVGTASVVADVAAIASGAAEDAAPEASAALGWASMALGLGGAAAGAVTGVSAGTRGLGQRLGGMLEHGMGGKGAMRAARGSLRGNTTAPLSEMAARVVAATDGVALPERIERRMPANIRRILNNDNMTKLVARKFLGKLGRPNPLDVQDKLGKLITMQYFQDEMYFSQKILDEYFDALAPLSGSTTIGQLNGYTRNRYLLFTRSPEYGIFVGYAPDANSYYITHDFFKYTSEFKRIANMRKDELFQVYNRLI